MTANIYNDEAIIRSVTYHGKAGHKISLELDPKGWERLKGMETTRCMMVLVRIQNDGQPDPDAARAAPHAAARPRAEAVPAAGAEAEAGAEAVAGAEAEADRSDYRPHSSPTGIRKSSEAAGISTGAVNFLIVTLPLFGSAIAPSIPTLE